MGELPVGLQDLVINGISVGFVIYALIEALKQARKMTGEYAPLTALGCGVAFSVAQWLAPEVTAVVVRGLGVGAITSLGYAAVKKAAQNSSLSAGGEQK